jgi:hypothetical protein
MNYTVTKNPVPLLWLDSNLIIALGKVRAGKDTTANVVALHEVLKQKTQEGKIIVVEHEQRDEIGASEPAKAVLSVLSLGVSTNHGWISQKQDILGVRAFLAEAEQKSLTVDDFFHGDPNARAAQSRGQQMIISARMPRTDQYKQGDKASRIEMSTRLNLTRRSNLNIKHINKQAVYEQHVEDERRAVKRVLNQALNYLAACDTGQVRSSREEYQKSYDIYSSFHLAWQLGGGAADAAQLLSFYDSEYYWNLPFHDIWIDIYSRRLTGINGGGEIKQSDVKDITNIASMLPVCSTITLDRAMATLVKQSGLASKYSTQVFSNRNIDELLAYVGSV